jgi:hypothetical protein
MFGCVGEVHALTYACSFSSGDLFQPIRIVHAQLA